jgi:hypothetical protein
MRVELLARRVEGGVAMPADLRTLRGAALARLAEQLQQLRLEGKACWRCDRLLAGGVCEKHGKTRPPRIRERRKEPCR